MTGKRQLLLELLAKDGTGPATKGAAENLGDVAAAAEEAAKATDNLGDQAKDSAEEVELFGKSNKSAAEHAEGLKREIENVENELHQLAVAFAEAETATDRADLSKSIRKTQSDLRQLNRSKKLVDDLIPGADPVPIQTATRNIDQLKDHIKGLKTAFLAAGTVEGRSFLSKAIKDAEGDLGDLEKYAGDVAPKIGAKLATAFSSISEVAVPVLAGVAVAAAPAIGATISGAIIGAVGLGGVVGGFAIAAKDPRVKQAASALKTEIGDELKDAAVPFVDVSTKGISEVGRAVKDIDFDQIFRDSAKNAQPVIDGVTTAVEALGHAFTDVIHNAGPVVKEIGDEIGAIGTTLGNGLESLADNGKEGAEALHQLFMVINGSISTVFDLVNGLTEVYGVLDKISGGGPTKVLDELAAANANVKDKAVGAAQAVIDAANANDELAGSAQAAARAAEDQRKALADLDKQERANVDPLFKLLNTQDQVTAAQKDYNDAVKKHGRSSEEARAAARQLAEASLDEADAVDQVSKTMDGKLTPAMERNLRKAGLNSKQIAAIKEELDRARGAADKFGQLKPVAHISANISGATGPIQHVAALLAGLPKSKHITVTVGTSVAGGITNLASLLAHRAGGGPVTKGKAYVVGEKRPEVFVPDRDGTIIPSVDQLGTSATRQAGTSAPQAVDVNVNFDFANAQNLMAQAFIAMLRTQPGFRATVVKTLKL